MISNLNPKLLYGSLIDRAALPATFAERIEKWRCGSGTFRMNVALVGTAGFHLPAGPRLAEHHTAGIIMAPSLAYMEQAYFDARTHGWSKQPIVEMLIPSTLDDTLAPKGQHVASLFCQHVAPELPDGTSWDDHREKVADLMIETVNALCAEFQSFGARPADHEPARSRAHFRPHRRRHLPWRARSISCFRRARCSAMPIIAGRCRALHVRLGHASGRRRHRLPGHNAAREILRDLKRRT